MTVHLQPRDLLILSEVGEYGFLSSTTIQSRHWPDAKSIRACQQRLRLLTDDGLLKRVHLLVAHQGNGDVRGVVGGSIPSAYALTPHGAEALYRTTGETARRVSKSDPAAATLLHRLEVVEARLAIDDACRAAKISPPEWIYEYDPIPGIKVKLGDPMEERFILYERFRIGEHEPYCRPDASCRMQIPTASGQGFDPLVVYWEIDRSSNSKAREREKTFGYDALIQTKTYAKHWPAADRRDPPVRVFYVCPSSERIDELVAEVRSIRVAQSYRFTTRDELLGGDPLFSTIWRGIDGKRYAIMRRSTPPT